MSVVMALVVFAALIGGALFAMRDPGSQAGQEEDPSSEPAWDWDFDEVFDWERHGL